MLSTLPIAGNSLTPTATLLQLPTAHRLPLCAAHCPPTATAASHCPPTALPYLSLAFALLCNRWCPRLCPPTATLPTQPLALADRCQNLPASHAHQAIKERTLHPRRPAPTRTPPLGRASKRAPPLGRAIERVPPLGQAIKRAPPLGRAIKERQAHCPVHSATAFSRVEPAVLSLVV